MSVNSGESMIQTLRGMLLLFLKRKGGKYAKLPRVLGISIDLLYRLRREYRPRENLAFPGHGRASLAEQEIIIRELEKDLQDTRMDRDIIK